MDYGSFPWTRRELKGNMADVVSRGGLAKTSWIVSKREHVLDTFSALVGRGK